MTPFQLSTLQSIPHPYGYVAGRRFPHEPRLEFVVRIEDASQNRSATLNAAVEAFDGREFDHHVYGGRPARAPDPHRTYAARFYAEPSFQERCRFARYEAVYTSWYSDPRYDGSFGCTELVTDDKRQRDGCILWARALHSVLFMYLLEKRSFGIEYRFAQAFLPEDMERMRELSGFDPHRFFFYAADLPTSGDAA